MGKEEKVVAVLVRGDHEVNEIKLKKKFLWRPGKELTLADKETVETSDKCAVWFCGASRVLKGITHNS